MAKISTAPKIKRNHFSPLDGAQDDDSCVARIFKNRLSLIVVEGLN